jgi:hypothetical protein
MAKQLTPKQAAFVAAYVGPARGNATEAARLAGYRGNAKTLGAVGDENLDKPGIKEAIAAHRDKIEKSGIAHLQARVDQYNERWFALRQIVSERATSPEMQNVAGGKTGWLVRTIKQIGGGDNAQVVEEYAFDAALHRELRELEKHAATDLGQWSEKREHSGPNGAPIPIQQTVNLSALTDEELAQYERLAEKVQGDGR